MTSVLAIEFGPCAHHKEGKRYINPIPDHHTFLDIFRQYHDTGNDSHNKPGQFSVHSRAACTGGQEHEVMASLSVGEVVHLFNVRNFVFQCHATQDERETLEEIANVATKRTVYAFQVLMSGGRSLPPKKKSR